MKKVIFLFLLGCLCSSLSKAQNTRAAYDSTLAHKLGADDYGMKKYVFVILKTGTYKPKDSIESQSLFMGHMANMQRLAKEGKLTVAGPFGKNELKYRGLFILNVSTLEEAQKLVQTDPAIKIGLFEVDLIPWYGSAALPEYLPIHEKVQKKNF